mgnify:FL=1
MLFRSYQPEKISFPRDVQDILAEVFQPKAVTTAAVAPPATPAVDAQLDAQLKEQDALILKLREQLAKLRPLAGIGESVLRRGVQPKTTLAQNSNTALQQTDKNAALIERLQGELMQARALATIGENRLSKWQQRNFR